MQMADLMFEPFRIKNVEFKNRLIRSSIGGRMAYYKGHVNDAWKHFEAMFAQGGIAGLISPTMTVSHHRWAPIEYPKISDPMFIPRIKEGVDLIHQFGVKYLVQIGDPGYHAQSAIFPRTQDHASSSSGFDLIYGYVTWHKEMPVDEIQQVVEHFGRSAGYVQESGCDGVEVTISKGYLIHQFLNPGINHRKDQYGGSLENRFRLLGQITESIRRRVGKDYLVGMRISANDYTHLPMNLRWPISSYWNGNTLQDTIQIGKWLKELGVDYLHVSNGFGFINPKENPGEFPLDAVRQFCNSARHLSFKAWLRSVLLNTPLGLLTKIGWEKPPQGPDAGPPPNLSDAKVLKEQVGLPVFSNGGFHRRHQIANALAAGACDMVSMARPLLANPDLPLLFRNGLDGPEQETLPLPFQNQRSDCTFCNRCAVFTTIYPVGCYDITRFQNHADQSLNMEDMESQIREWAGEPNWWRRELPEAGKARGAAASAGAEAGDHDHRHEG